MRWYELHSQSACSHDVIQCQPCAHDHLHVLKTLWQQLKHVYILLRAVPVQLSLQRFRDKHVGLIVLVRTVGLNHSL